ncbi:MAG: hypothetical protein IJ676_01180 [Clostridia bacterium]|nr:hypothetical protein [Clostridia bacterium]
MKRKALGAILLLVAIIMLACGLGMMLNGCTRNGRYELVGYKETNGKVTDVYYDDDYNNFGLGFGGFVLMLAGVAVGIISINILKSTIETGPNIDNDETGPNIDNDETGPNIDNDETGSIDKEKRETDNIDNTSSSLCCGEEFAILEFHDCFAALYPKEIRGGRGGLAHRGISRLTNYCFTHSTGNPKTSFSKKLDNLDSIEISDNGLSLVLIFKDEYAIRFAPPKEEIMTYLQKISLLFKL